MGTRRVVVHYPRHLIDVPLVSRMARQFDLELNILRANTTPRSEGVMVLGLEGREDSIGKALDRVRRQGAGVQSLDKNVRRDEGRCTQCAGLSAQSHGGGALNEVPGYPERSPEREGETPPEGRGRAGRAGPSDARATAATQSSDARHSGLTGAH